MVTPLAPIRMPVPEIQYGERQPEVLTTLETATTSDSVAAYALLYDSVHVEQLQT